MNGSRDLGEQILMGKIFLRHGERLSLIQTLSSETFQVPTAKVTEILQEKEKSLLFI